MSKLLRLPNVILASATFVLGPFLWAQTTAPGFDPKSIAQLLTEAKSIGDAKRGAVVFHSAQFACVSCHKVGKIGGSVGPDLTAVGKCLKPEEIAESLLWPKRTVKDEFKAIAVITLDGKTHQGYKQRETEKELVLRDSASGKDITIAKSKIDERNEIGTLMPDGLMTAMSAAQKRDLVRFLLDLGHTEGLADLAPMHSHVAATFPLERKPINTAHWPNWQAPVNRFRIYDFYSRQADHFMKQSVVPPLLAGFPGLEGPEHSHWGTQSEKTWVDDRWNNAKLGSVMSGVFHGAGLTVNKAFCLKLGDQGELSVCFNPETLCYEALWQKGFVKFSSVRHGFLHGLLLDGIVLPRPEGKKPERAFEYRGFYRHGPRVVFSYVIDGVEMLDAPWVENGKFTRVVASKDRHPLAHLAKGGAPQWPQVLETRGTVGQGGPYAIDTIAPPFDNPWKAPLFFGDHDFLPDGSALLCTMQGDVWKVEGLDDKLDRVRWRRFASGLHQSLGLIVSKGQIYVLGRDQITRLHDFDGDGEADYHECVCNGYITSPGGHDYICGLQRDDAGYFYTASSKQGLLRISPDGKKVDVLATGFRNPDGVGLCADGALTVPCSEGEWTSGSMICLIKPSANDAPYFGYGGPKDGKPPALPLVYLPRGVDNSSGGQIRVTSDRWGPLKDLMVHFSYGAASHLLLLRDQGDGQPQGAVIPLPGEFQSGAHRGRFHPKDGQLYVTGMGGWGNYSVADGCFHRVRYTGAPVQLPSKFRVHDNGIHLSFTRPVDPRIAGDLKSYFAQAWNYRYSSAYGSPEFSTRHPGVRGHDHLPIQAVHLLGDGSSLFLEMPDLQPVNQVHLRLRVDEGTTRDMFLTIHRLGAPFTEIPNYKPVTRTIAAHPILFDLAAAKTAVANPWRKQMKDARQIGIQADNNLTFAQRSLTVKAGETIRLNFSNPDTVPHNWVLIKPGALPRVGEMTNRLIAEPEAAARQYVPDTSDVLLYTDIVPPEGSFTIYFRAPAQKGRYPYLCTFPGHWMVMNGVMIVE